MPERDPDPIVLYTVVRTSNQLSVGKLVAQGQHAVHYLVREAEPEGWPTREEMDLRSRAHLHPEAMTEAMTARLATIDDERKTLHERLSVYREWDRSPTHTKIVLAASDEEFMQVQLENDHFFMVTDLGFTEVEPDTETCLCLWPMRKSARSPILKKLKPL